MPDLPTPTPSPSTKDNGPGQEPPSPTASGGEEKDEINPALSSDEDEGKSAPNCCERCCGSFMTIVAHDAIYGSFVGPHPVSFLCLCRPFRCCCEKCVPPFCVSSIVTKIMYFIMLGIVSLLAGFFVIPWPVTFLSFDATSIASFFPCQKNKTIRNSELNGGCEAHAGYFMVYRCFFAFATLMLTNSALMLFIKSTSQSPHRAKIHQGFWFYKYLYLAGLLFLYFLFLDGSTDVEGVFEFTCSIIGNLAHLLFSLVEITFIMDLVELWVIENRTSGSKWADFIYWTATVLIFIGDFLILASLCSHFSLKRKFDEGADFWPHDNCVIGQWDTIDPLHSAMIGGAVLIIVGLIAVMWFREKFKNRFPYTGWIQVSVMTLFNLVYVFSALFSSPNVHSRPRCNWALFTHAQSNKTHPAHFIQEGSNDIYFRFSGLLHAILAILSLLYFAFVHGPRSKSAPFSIAYNYLFTGQRNMPVFPDMTDAPPQFTEAIEKLKVWDDETKRVAISWSLFYSMMTLGALSIMMSMTNFTDPWAPDRYNSSWVAFSLKFITAVVVTGVYAGLLLMPCNKIYPVYETHEVHRVEQKVITVVSPTVEDRQEEKQVIATKIEEQKDEAIGVQGTAVKV